MSVSPSCDLDPESPRSLQESISLLQDNCVTRGLYAQNPSMSVMGILQQLSEFPVQD